MLKNYFNIAVSLILIGIVVAFVMLFIDKLRKKHVIKIYMQLVLFVAIIGSIIGGLLDRIISPYLMYIKEQLFNINLYTPILVAMIFVMLFRKIINGFDA